MHSLERGETGAVEWVCAGRRACAAGPAANECGATTGRTKGANGVGPTCGVATVGAETRRNWCGRL